MLDNIWDIENIAFSGIKVESQELDNIHKIIEKLKKQPEVNREEIFWDETLHCLYTIRWQWLNVAAPFNSVSEHLDQNIEFFNKKVYQAKELNYLSYELMNDLLNKIIKIRTMNNSPLTDDLIGKLDKQKRICLVSTTSNNSYLKVLVNNMSRKWQVKTINQYRNEDYYDEAYIFGELNHVLGRGRYSDGSDEFIFTSPRAKNNFWVHYEWTKLAWEVSVSLDGYKNKINSLLKENQIFSEIPTSSTSSIDFTPKINEEKYKKLISESLRYHQENEDHESSTTPAFCFLLSEKSNEKDLAAFISDEGSQTSMAISDFDGDGTLDIWRFKPQDIKKGMYILRRTDSAQRDVIEELADESLGEQAKKLRNSQKEWKNYLNQKVTQIGLEQSVTELKNLGCNPASIMNIKRWIWQSSIKTSKQSDFFALMKFSNVEHRAQEYWSDMRKINAAHGQAGRDLIKLLKDKIEEVDANEITGKTKYDFSLSDTKNLGMMSAYQISDRMEEVIEVPRSWCYWGVREL